MAAVVDPRQRRHGLGSTVEAVEAEVEVEVAHGSNSTLTVRGAAEAEAEVDWPAIRGTSGEEEAAAEEAEGQSSY